MARTKAFDPDVAVERALDTFWTRGYAGTSAQDLVDALAINRSSLYSTFGSKSELYRAALARYAERPQEWTRTLLDGPGDFRSRLRTALAQAVDDDLDPHRSRGCFVCNAAVELGPVDAEVRRLVTRGLAEVRAAFRDALTRARDDGELAAGAHVEALAGLLVTAFEGLHVLAKGTQDRRLVAQSIETLVSVL